MKKIADNIYLLKLELKNNPLKNINCYLIEDEVRPLLIDTGFNIKKNFKLIKSKLKEKNIALKNLDVLITHMHSDHCGLSYDFQINGSIIFASKKDAKFINAATKFPYWKTATEAIIKNGFPFDKDINDIKSHPAYEYHPQNQIKFSFIKEGDIIKKGGYSFKVIETPGHSPGHICLYDNKKKILFAGDHILSNITPNIYPENLEKNPLKDYLKSLSKIRKLKPEKVLPAHRNEIADYDKRISELIEHHKNRLNEIVTILKDSDGLTAFEVAGKIKWDLKVKSFDNFPTSQKWFATGEALSHLLYLYEEGKIKRRIKDNKYVYSTNRVGPLMC